MACEEQKWRRSLPSLLSGGQMVNFPALCMRSCNCIARSGRSSGREGGGAHNPGRSILFLNLIYSSALIKACGHRMSLMPSLWLPREPESGEEIQIPQPTLLTGYVNIGWRRRGPCSHNTYFITGCANIMQTWYSCLFEVIPHNWTVGEKYL